MDFCCYFLESFLLPRGVARRQGREEFRSNSARKCEEFFVQTMSRTVTIDARWIVGGIGTYIRNLLYGLHELGNGLQVHAIVRSGDKASVQGLCARSTIVDVPIYTASEQVLIPRAARGCELLHIPHFNAPLFHRGPMVVTIMDVIHLSSPAYRNRLSSHMYAKPI